MADAYFVLSDPERRKEYDSLYRSKKERTEDPSASANFFTNFANMFGGKGPESAPGNAERPDADYMFADVFDEVSGFHSILAIITILNLLRCCCFHLASTTRGPKSCSVVGVPRSRLWCRFRVHRCEHSWFNGWSVRWKPFGCS